MGSLAGSRWVWIALLLLVGAVAIIGMNLSPQWFLLPSRDHGGAQATVAATPLPAAPSPSGHPSQEFGIFRIPVQEVADGSAQPPSLGLPNSPTEAEQRAVYDEAASVLLDGSLSHSDRRNRLRLVRRSFGDALFFAVIRDVPVYDPGTGRTVTFADYMLDLAGTFIGHPQAPITFDPVGAATQIYFSPTDDTVRRMTGIGLTDEQVRKYSAMYRGMEVEPEVTEDPAKVAAVRATAAGGAVALGQDHNTSQVESGGARQQPPEAVGPASVSAPAFIARDPELSAAYNQARELFTDVNETEASRREKARVMRQNLGEEKMTLLLRYMPIVDLDSGNVQSFGDYMRDMASSYDSGSGSPMDKDPVGAAMTMFFDPSADTVAAMTGIGLSGRERQEVFEKYEREQVDLRETANRIVSDTSSQFNWEEVHRAAGDAASGIFSVFGGK